MQVDIANMIISVIIGGFAGLVSASFQFGRHKEKVDTLKSSAEKTESDLKAIKDEIKDLIKQAISIEVKLEERTYRGSERLLKRKSPVSLNESGEKLLHSSGGDEFVIKNLDELIKLIEAKNPQSAYDIQEYSKTALKSLSSDARIIPLKDYAFKEGIELDDIITVMGVYLRDKALKRLGYTLQQIDESEPKKE